MVSLFKSGEASPNLFPFPCFFLCQIFFGSQKEVLLPMQEDHAFFSVCPTGEHFPKRFHHVLNHMKMINDDLRFWQDCLNGWTKRGAHILTVRFHSLWITQSLKRLDDLFLFSSLTHL